MMYIYSFTTFMFLFMFYSTAMELETESTVLMGFLFLGMGVGAIVEIYQIIRFIVNFVKSAVRRSEIPKPVNNGLFLPCLWSWCLFYLAFEEEELLKKILGDHEENGFFAILTAFLILSIGALFELQRGLLTFCSNYLFQRTSKVEIDTEAQKK